MKLLFGGDFYPDNRFMHWMTSIPRNQELHHLSKEHDLFVVNLEAPLTSKIYSNKKIGPNLVGNPEAVLLIKQLGINALSLANNHILDMGPTGIEDTIKLCKKTIFIILVLGEI